MNRNLRIFSGQALVGRIFKGVAVGMLVGLCAAGSAGAETTVTLNQKTDGYRGIWYMNQPVDNEYRYKYSGGLGTYCDYHSPFAVYRPEVGKTFFCYGGSPEGNPRRLLHMVSYYDHKTGTVPRPTILLDKHTDDAHDNPVISVDADGYIWIFSTSHGTGRPSYIHRSTRPYDVSEFELVPAVYEGVHWDWPVDNFSYFQVFHEKGSGFRAIFTRYNDPADRTACFMKSADGVRWTEVKRLGAIEQGHYQIGASGAGKLASMMNMHPKGKGLNWRTNLYYMESADEGTTWKNAAGEKLKVPLVSAKNPALVRDYQAEGLLVYIKDLQFDGEGHPMLLYLLSKSFEPGPGQGDRTLTLARWNGSAWGYHTVATMDHNYDSAALWRDGDGLWRIIMALGAGPQPYGTGGEMAVYASADEGATWKLEKELTSGSLMNQTYARRPVNAHPDFTALWADGNARQPSESRIYFSNAKGEVFRLPAKMTGDSAKPERVGAGR